jgi:hypothetical protein
LHCTRDGDEMSKGSKRDGWFQFISQRAEGIDAVVRQNRSVDRIRSSDVVGVMNSAPRQSSVAVSMRSNLARPTTRRHAENGAL